MASVTIKKWATKENQSVFDIALQLYGTVEKAMQLVVDNGLSGVNAEIPNGTELIYTLQSSAVPKFFSVNNYVVANWVGVSELNIELLDDNSIELRDDLGDELRDG